MEILDSVIVTLVLKMKEIVILMMSVKIVFYVDQIIVKHHLVFTQTWIVVIHIQEVNILDFNFQKKYVHLKLYRIEKVLTL